MGLRVVGGNCADTLIAVTAMVAVTSTTSGIRRAQKYIAREIMMPFSAD